MLDKLNICYDFLYGTKFNKTTFNKILIWGKLDEGLMTLQAW